MFTPFGCQSAYISQNISFASYNSSIKYQVENCAYCGVKFNYKNKRTLDHIFAKSKGGENGFDNFVVVCEKCNVNKDRMSLVDYIKKNPHVINCLKDYLRQNEHIVVKGWKYTDIIQKKLKRTGVNLDMEV